MRVALEPNSRITLPVGSGNQEYIIDGAIGSGATCIVYSAHRHDAAGHRRDVRIKECYPYDAGIARNGSMLLWNDSAEQSVMLDCFRNAYQKLSEMQNTQGLRNSTAHVFDLCEANGTLYSVMDVTEGKTFDNDIGCSLHDCLKTTLALTRAVEKYHANGYLHLDIKPGNFLVIPETRELLVLFDVDTVTAQEDIRTGKVTNISFSKNWAAPEQMQGKIHKLCPATDLYAIGTILFERVFARPVSSEDMGIFARWDYDKSLCASENPKIRQLLTEIFHKTLSANIRNRYQSANELAAALEETIRVVDKGTPYLLTTAPTSHINFVGRREELQRISNTFKNGKKCIFLQGFGGIGKTELAKKYVETYADSYDHIVFLRYSEKQRSIKSLLLDNIQIANYEDDRNDNEAERRKKRLEKTRELLNPSVLIILDNYDVEILDDEFMELLDWNATWLVTTRSDFSYLGGQTMQIPVAQMAFSDLLEIFRRESRQQVNEKQAAALEKLFAQFDNYTMVVTLLAKQVYATGLTVEELCGNEDIYEYEEKLVSAKDAAVTQNTLLGHLQRVFNMAALSDDQQEALRTAWMMRDANEITKQFYKKYSGLSLNPLNSLISLGWLQYDDSAITFHPVIEQLVERTLKPTCQNCPSLYQAFLQRLSALRKAIDADDSMAYSHETENLFRLYVFLIDTDEQTDENLLQLSLCLLDLYEQYEVPEFMWFSGWENQAYFYPKILRALSFAKSEIAEENTVIDGKQIYDQPLTLYAANLCCDFCRMQLENLEHPDCTDEMVDNVVAVYGASLWAIVWHEVHQQEKPSIRRQVKALMNLGGNSGISNSIFMQSGSICENGNYHDGLECDYIRGIVPHRNERYWTLFVSMHLALGVYFDSVLNVEKHTKQYQEYNQALNRMYAEILRAGIGYDHFYDFYDVPEEKAKELFAAGAIWTAEKHFNHAEGIEYFDENDTLAYFAEVVQTLQSAKHPFYLYKLLLNYDFRISDELKEMLIEWNIGKQIAEDVKMSNIQKRHLAEFAIKNCNEGSAPNLQQHCFERILKCKSTPQTTKYGIYNAIASKFIFHVGDFLCESVADGGSVGEYYLYHKYYPMREKTPNTLALLADAMYEHLTGKGFTADCNDVRKAYIKFLSRVAVSRPYWGDDIVVHVELADALCGEVGFRSIIEHIVPKAYRHLMRPENFDPGELSDLLSSVETIERKYSDGPSIYISQCPQCQTKILHSVAVCPFCGHNLE